MAFHPRGVEPRWYRGEAVLSRYPKCRTGGFTLVELMVVVAVGAILAMIAVPSLLTTLQNNQLDTVSNQLVAALATARSEAVRAPDAVLTVSNPANTLQWQRGWETDITTTTTAGVTTTAMLNAPTAVPGQVTVWSNAGGPVKFDAMGRLIMPGGATPPATLVFVICADGTTLVGKSRAVIVSASGRTNIARIGTGPAQGIPLKDDGTPVNSCTVP